MISSLVGPVLGAVLDAVLGAMLGWVTHAMACATAARQAREGPGIHIHAARQAWEGPGIHIHAARQAWGALHEPPCKLALKWVPSGGISQAVPVRAHPRPCICMVYVQAHPRPCICMVYVQAHPRAASLHFLKGSCVLLAQGLVLVVPSLHSLHARGTMARQCAPRVDWSIEGDAIQLHPGLLGGDR